MKTRQRVRLATARGLQGLDPRPELRQLPPAVHGGIDLEELDRLGLSATDVLDFSANINPYGPAPGVHAALAGVAIEQYPDPEARLLRRAFAEHVGVTSERILPGNGVSELIWLAALAFLRPGDRVVVVGPTYCEYARAAFLMTAAVTTWQARADDQFAVAEDAIARLLDTQRPRLVFVCNPNNPTGAIIDAETLAHWARQHPATCFVVDEAYLSFAADLESSLRLATSNVLVLRSLTKDFGLAGLRLGFAVGDKEAIRWLSRVQPPWSVNVLAQSAGVAALRDLDHWQCCLTMLRRAKTELVAGLTGLGLMPVPSAVPFFLVPVGDGSRFRLSLLRYGIVVRDCASFGLPGYVRIATRRPEENRRLLAAVREVHHAG